MKQIARFFLSPSTFFNQLQWSRAHWLILFAFGVFALAETQTSQNGHLYSLIVDAVGRDFGLSLTQSLWVVSAVKLALMFLGVFFVSHIIWIAGNTIGERGSKRVLFRRLSVVFSVFLAGACVQNLSFTQPSLIMLSAALYVWGTILGFYAIKNQFDLNSLETAIVSSLAVLIVTATLHMSDHAAKRIVVMAYDNHSDANAISSHVEENEAPFGFQQ